MTTTNIHSHDLNGSSVSVLPPRRSQPARTIAFFLWLTFTFLQGQAMASGNKPGQVAENAAGYLQVYSATEQAAGTEPGPYFLHTGYRIYDSAGNVVKWVGNHDGDTDEAPQTIELKPGTYAVWAQAGSGRYVKMPVVIRPARTTTVRLENI